MVSFRNFKIAKGAVVCTEAQLLGDITIGKCVVRMGVNWIKRFPEEMCLGRVGRDSRVRPHPFPRVILSG